MDDIKFNIPFYVYWTVMVLWVVTLFISSLHFRATIKLEQAKLDLIDAYKKMIKATQEQTVLFKEQNTAFMDYVDVKTKQNQLNH